MRRFAIDGMIGLAVFTVLAGLCISLTGARAEPLTPDIVTFATDSVSLGQQLLAQLPLSGEPRYASWLPGNVFRRTDPAAAGVLLALVVSVLTALNIGFCRHLVHAYRPPRSRSRIG